MKNKRALIILFALLLFLVSCGQEEESVLRDEPEEVLEEIKTEETPAIEEVQPAAPPVEAQATEAAEETKAPTSEGPSSDLGKKMLEAEDQIKSFKTIGSLEIVTNIKEVGEFALVNDIETIYVKEPFFVHSITKSKPLEGSEVPLFDMDLEFYQDKTQMWISSSLLGGTWMRMDAQDENFESYDQFSYAQSPASIYGENFDLFDVEKKGSDYLLTLTGDGEDWSEIIATILENDPQLQEDQEEVEVHYLMIEVLVDGSNYLPKEFRIDMDFTIKDDEEGVNIKQKGNFLYSDYNVYKDMKVPQEVLDAVVN